MKARYQFLILIGVAFALYIVRADVETVYERALPYVVKTYTAIKDDIGSINLRSDKAVPLEESTSTPGALKVTTGLTSYAKVNLSIKEVIVMTNKNRKDNGNLSALRENLKLNRSAKIKLDDMFAQHYFEHESPTGIGIKELSGEVNYEYIILGENLALGNFKDSEALLDAWMASPGHRANILNGHYTEIGVAVGSGIFQGEKVWMAVQHFGVPRSDCPSVDEVLHGQIDLKKKNIETMSAELSLRKKRIESGAVYEGKTTNEQIEVYNQLVATHNHLILDTKKMTETYNSQIKSLNDCINKNLGSHE